jgi:hypothetical protein
LKFLRSYTVFSSIRKANASQNEAGQPNENFNPTLQENLDKLIDLYQDCKVLLSDYDRKLIRVVEKHEHDFLNAYKTHMSKVERELISLKTKAADQELRLANDERLLKL